MDNDGYIVLPRENSSAEIIVNWKKRSSLIQILFDIFSAVPNNGFLMETKYLNNDLSLVSNEFGGNGASAKITNKQMNIRFGASKPEVNQYAYFISNTEKIKLIFLYSQIYASGEYKFKNVFVDDKSEVTPYEPYQSQPVTIPLTEPLRGIGNIRDRITLKDGVWGVERNVGETVFDGKEEWTSYGNVNEGASFFYYELKTITGYQTSICNMFQNRNNSWDSSNFGKVGIYSDHQNNNKNFRPPNSSITTVEQFKSWLAERYAEGNPVKLVYKLNSVYSTFEPFDQATQSVLNALHTHQGTTNIMIIGESPDMSLEYVQDINVAIDKVDVQSDWNVINTNANDYIKNKPTNFPPTVHNHTKSQITDFPTKLSQFTNDSNFITNTVSNLTNYYNKTSSYSKAEVNVLISNITTVNIEKVNALPTTNISMTTIYLLAKSQTPTKIVSNIYEEYINLDGSTNGWELIGTTEVNLTNYYTKFEIDGKLNSKADDIDIPTKLSQLTNDLLGYKVFTYTTKEPITINENEIVFVYE